MANNPNILFSRQTPLSTPTQRPPTSPVSLYLAAFVVYPPSHGERPYTSKYIYNKDLCITWRGRGVTKAANGERRASPLAEFRFQPKNAVCSPAKLPILPYSANPLAESGKLGKIALSTWPAIFLGDPNMQRPRQTIQIGSLRYRSLADVAAQFPSMTSKAAFSMVRSLGVRFIHFGRDAYILEDALEEALRILTRLGGPGFAAPGSLYKKRYGTKNRPPLDTEVYLMPPKLLSDANRARVLKEMTALGRRNAIITRRQTTKIAEALSHRLHPAPPGTALPPLPIVGGTMIEESAHE